MRIPNLEYRIKKIKDFLGLTDISSIGDGTVSGAISSQSDQIEELGPYNGLDSTSTVAALSAAQGKALKSLIDGLNLYTNKYTITSAIIDTIFDYGIYFGFIANSVFGDTGSYGALIVVGINSVKVQVVVSQSRIATRFYENNTWSNWKSVSLS